MVFLRWANWPMQTGQSMWMHGNNLNSYGSFVGNSSRNGSGWPAAKSENLWFEFCLLGCSSEFCCNSRLCKTDLSTNLLVILAVVAVSFFILTVVSQSLAVLFATLELYNGGGFRWSVSIFISSYFSGLVTWIPNIVAHLGQV